LDFQITCILSESISIGATGGHEIWCDETLQTSQSSFSIFVLFPDCYVRLVASLEPFWNRSAFPVSIIAPALKQRSSLLTFLSTLCLTSFPWDDIWRG
jgi:hypothetical protein